MVIYCTVNKVNFKKYIGQSTKDDSNYLGSGTLLKEDIKKYGKDNFFKFILEYCKNEDELNEREKYWIAKFNASNNPLFYNIAKGGRGWGLCEKNPNYELIKKKISDTKYKRFKSGEIKAWNKGRKVSEQERIRLSSMASKLGDKNGMYGKKHSLESKIKLSETRKKLMSEGLLNTHKGFVRSVESNLKQSESMKKLYKENKIKNIFNYNNPSKGKPSFNRRKIRGININNPLDVREYDFVNEAKKDGFFAQNIRKTIKGVFSQYKGYKWEYVYNTYSNDK